MKKQTIRPAILYWFRQDLRLRDNPALAAALAEARAQNAVLLPVYLWAPEEEGDWPAGAAARWWLHQSLQALEQSLQARGSRLLLYHGGLERLLAQWRPSITVLAVYCNERYEPAARSRELELRQYLRQAGIAFQSYASATLWKPGSLRTQAGQPFRVFTPFWRLACTQGVAPEAVLPEGRWPAPVRWPPSSLLRDLHLEPRPDWAQGLRETWKPGEAGGQAALRRFLRNGIHSYAQGRELPGQRGTSRLSPYLHFGEVSAASVWRAVMQSEPGRIAAAQPCLRQLAWRDFASHLLFHFPETATQPLRPEFARFPWRMRREYWTAWRRGRTGYPLVDAGMRELWHTGWMHNRVRMVTASFLVKHLLIPWQRGAEWFWDTLVDADLANNSLGWQWAAGCGADAAPYFRIFNPMRQADRFDSKLQYIRRWVPERVTESAAIYPPPIVEHDRARERALAAWATLREKLQNHAQH